MTNLLGDNRSFWHHERKMHVICFENKFDQLNYFKLALDIEDRLDILSILAMQVLASVQLP